MRNNILRVLVSGPLLEAQGSIQHIMNSTFLDDGVSVHRFAMFDGVGDHKVTPYALLILETESDYLSFKRKLEEGFPKNTTLQVDVVDIGKNRSPIVDLNAAE